MIIRDGIIIIIIINTRILHAKRRTVSHVRITDVVPHIQIAELSVLFSQ